jgi:tetratricopeptide (TPR) repeat protein
MCVSLSAQTTGTLAGKVLDSAGKPVANVKFTASKIGINWIKEIPVGKDGKYVQVGFAPGDYDLSVSAPGFREQKVSAIHLGVGIVTQKDFVLLTPEEANKEAIKGGAAPVADPSALAENKGVEAYNKAVLAFNEKRFAEALPLFEFALTSLNESVTKTTDDAAKAETQKSIATIERPAALSMIEVGKVDSAQQLALATKAEPLLLRCLERDPKDQASLLGMIEVAKAKKDLEGEKKYQAALDAVLGPRPELAYNQGVELYNAGKLAEAKPFFKKAIQIKADYAEAYFLLAMCEFTDMNLKGTKSNLQEYLKLAPAGKNAATAKEMLADPTLKNIK